jgi:hypothetical protein
VALDRLVADPAVARVWIIHGRPDPGTVALYQRWHATWVMVAPAYVVARHRCQAMRPASVLVELDRWYADPPTLPTSAIHAG